MLFLALNGPNILVQDIALGRENIVLFEPR